MALTVRRSVHTDTLHIERDDNGGTLCNTRAHTVRTWFPIDAANCSRCRKLAELPALHGSIRERESRGLDSSAWGANKGR